MFSKDDIEYFTIEIELPKREPTTNPVEQLLTSCPLTTLKRSTMANLMITLREKIEELPVMVQQGNGVSLTLTDKKATLHIFKQTENEASEDKEPPKPFSEDTLRLISNDFNFLQAKLLGVLKTEVFKAEVQFKVSKKTEKGISFDTFFSQPFWDSFKEFEGIHVKGIYCETSIVLSGLKTPSRIEVKNEEDKIESQIQGNMEIKGPLDFVSMVKERLEVINAFYKKVTG